MIVIGIILCILLFFLVCVLSAIQKELEKNKIRKQEDSKSLRRNTK